MELDSIGGFNSYETHTKIRVGFYDIHKARMNQIELLADMYSNEGWKDLNYKSWDEYISTEFDKELANYNMELGEKISSVKMLRGNGMSISQVSEVLGISTSTVKRYQREDYVTIKLNDLPDINNTFDLPERTDMRVENPNSNQDVSSTEIGENSAVSAENNNWLDSMILDLSSIQDLGGPSDVQEVETVNANIQEVETVDADVQGVEESRVFPLQYNPTEENVIVTNESETSMRITKIPSPPSVAGAGHCTCCVHNVDFAALEGLYKQKKSELLP